jgi:hypothetical protein
MSERQPEKFLKDLKLSKINIPDMQKLLLGPQIAFTTNLPGEQQTSPTHCVPGSHRQRVWLLA